MATQVRHSFQPGEHPTLSAPTKISLITLLPSPFTLTEVMELPLNGVGEAVSVPDLTSISLKPMQTRTFEVTIKA